MKIPPTQPGRNEQLAATNAALAAAGAPLIPIPAKSGLRVLEPHEFNRILADRQKARGEEKNIPQPQMSQAFVCDTKAPKMRDLRKEAQAKALGRGKTPTIPGLGGEAATERPD